MGALRYQPPWFVRLPGAGEQESSYGRAGLRDGAVTVLRADGAEVDIETAAADFLADSGAAFSRRTPAKPVAKSEFLNRLELLSG